MPISKGSTKIGAVYKGSLNFRRIYHGSTLVFGNKEVFEQTFTASGSITFPLSLLSLYVIVVGSGGSGGNFGNFGNYYIGGDGDYNHVGDPSPGWPVSGGTYGPGGGGFAAWQSGQGGVGCVYIRYEY